MKTSNWCEPEKSENQKRENLSKIAILAQKRKFNPKFGTQILENLTKTENFGTQNFP